MSETLTAGAEAASAAVTKRWWYVHLANSTKVLEFLNGDPPQVAGEMSATTRPDGSVDLYYFSKVGPS